MTETENEARSKIFFVDDEADLQIIYAGLCKLWGYDSSGTQDPTKAIDAILEYQPNLIFLDLLMPHLNGFQLLEKLKADKRVAHIPVVMLTGKATAVPDKVQGLSRGALDYLLKPIDQDEMLARIQTYLRAQKEAKDESQKREIDAVRNTAVFLNHSINNLLMTIQCAAELDADENEDDPEAQERRHLIVESVSTIHEVVERLKKVKQVVVRSYADTEEMLDIDSSLDADSPPTGDGNGTDGPTE